MYHTWFLDTRIYQLVFMNYLIELYGFVSAVDQCPIFSGCACMGLVVIEALE